MTKKDRIEKYLEYKGIKPTPFAKAIGVSNSHVSEIDKRANNRVLFSAIRKSLDFSDCNTDWIATGGGEMLIPAVEVHDSEKFKKLAGAIQGKEPPTEFVSQLSHRETVLLDYFRQCGDDQKQHLIDCAKMLVDATLVRQSPGIGGGESDLTKKRSA